MDFKSTLALHLDAMKGKDLDKFISTVNLEDVVVIMPNGNLIKEKDKFVDLHTNWFADNDWDLDYEILNTVESSELAYALAAIDYKDCDAEGNTINMHYYLNLIFSKQDEKWLLTHDQNTIYKKA